MVARLPTEQEVVGSSPTLGFQFSCTGGGGSQPLRPFGQNDFPFKGLVWEKRDLWVGELDSYVSVCVRVRVTGLCFVVIVEMGGRAVTRLFWSVVVYGITVFLVARGL
jgi:hypothetical protein